MFNQYIQCVLNLNQDKKMLIKHLVKHLDIKLYMYKKYKKSF